MPQQENKVLGKMLERLFAAMANGPSLNCKPHSSRQRVDLAQFARLQDRTPEQLLKDLLGEARSAKVVARVTAPPKRPEPPETGQTPEGNGQEGPSCEDKVAQQAWSDQQSLLGKLRTIAEDARTYENDTGVHVLHIGFPLLSLPPGSFGLQRSFTRRILAPLAFISVTLTVRGGAPPAVVLECRNGGEDLVVPNSALLSWLEQQTGQEAADLFADEAGEQPWKEIAGIVQRVASLVELPTPELFADPAAAPERLTLAPAPRSEETSAKASILLAAILGLFPMSNQGLLRDTQALAAGESAFGPIQSFLSVDASLLETQPQSAPAADQPVRKQPRAFSEERLVSAADPCQSRAVKLARTCGGLVVHGPPGTGKSQTITNIIGDHLARGQRVLLVCDKRTALDVVINRLESLGLAQLCAVVYDPQRDQRELYKSIREQLDALSDVRTDDQARAQLQKTDTELQKLHGELSAYHAALMERGPSGGVSFHELMGRWLQLPDQQVEFTEATVQGVTPEKLEEHETEIRELLQRAEVVAYPRNPWVLAAGVTLAEFLSRPMEQVREAMAACVEAGSSVDATLDPSIPPFAPEIKLKEQAGKRTQLAEMLGRLGEQLDSATLARWAQVDLRILKQQRQKLRDVAPLVELLRSGPPDTELSLATGGNSPALPVIGQQLAALDAYLGVAGKWYAALCFGKKSAARRVLSGLVLPFDIPSVQRLKKFLLTMRARLMLQSLYQELTKDNSGTVSDESLDASLAAHSLLFDALILVCESAALVPIQSLVARSFPDKPALAALIDGLAKSPARAEAIEGLEAALTQAALCSQEWLTSFSNGIRGSNAAAQGLSALADHLDLLESALRVREGLAALPDKLGQATAQLVRQGVSAQDGWTVLSKAVLALQITQRLKSDPKLQGVDGHKLQSGFDRYRALETHKKALVRDCILNHWVGRQTERLLAQTGSRLNGRGADLRRRLTLRGQRAMRLRQVIAAGRGIEEGDPLFDLRPVWMASPETVAQVFPRLALFDVVIFDEASQCRLEEALPVLTRARRLVVAGDPKQLPPTRFFESALAVSEDEDADSEQALFEQQQGEVEDLLAAALNIEIEECYLDVHYRSRNADLIEFSNHNFYNSRLQPIPGHPSNRDRYAPLTLYRCDGVYEMRCNPAEAERVCRIVQDLLKRAAPPSIGIACFNLQQRDLILQRLEELAADDHEFARRLAEARTRRGTASFEGLFVKNLENVQGDERDHIIISTTYGPDAKGRFYRRFGPLGRAGGGRRLNVLITRAREEVHLVTSILANVYRALPPVPAGEAPGGAWLLFSYLAYAERLAEQYELNHRLLAQVRAEEKARVNVRPSRWPSRFSQALGADLAGKHNVGSDVHWGNDGFCVDLALHHPKRADDVTIGVLCDLTRFEQAEDPVEWEVFRTGILEGQSWKLKRLWTPHFFRDRQGSTQAILRSAVEVLSTEEEKDSIRVVENPNGQPGDAMR